MTKPVQLGLKFLSTGQPRCDAGNGRVHDPRLLKRAKCPSDIARFFDRCEDGYPMLKTTPWTQVEEFWVRGFLARVGPDLLARGDRRVLASRVQPATAFSPGMVSSPRPVVWHWELFDAFGTCIGSGSEANPEAGKAKADEAAVRAGYELG